jgi:hypothetical protein
VKGVMLSNCKYCDKQVTFEDLLEHEDGCEENLENIDEGDSIECGDW